MSNDEEYTPSSYKEYLSYLVYYNGDLTKTLINDLEEDFEFYYAYDIKDSNEELDTDDFHTVYKKVSDGSMKRLIMKNTRKQHLKSTTSSLAVSTTGWSTFSSMPETTSMN